MIKTTGDLNQEELLFRLLRPVGQASRQHRQIFENSVRGHKPVASIRSLVAVYHGLVSAAMAYLDRGKVLRAKRAVQFKWQRSALGQSRRFDDAPIISGLPLRTDIGSTGRHASTVPTSLDRADWFRAHKRT
jgi:hypothetical protein